MHKSGRCFKLAEMFFCDLINKCFLVCSFRKADIELHILQTAIKYKEHSAMIHELFFKKNPIKKNFAICYLRQQQHRDFKEKVIT